MREEDACLICGSLLENVSFGKDLNFEYDDLQVIAWHTRLIFMQDRMSKY
jgi:hypothetical protein